ncbi:MAG: AmmeMemoRadiSam system protein A [Acidobacteria bacterium]|nr:AmmeMemoRadiSam system protein A [Acidobacteriota bacterium]
MTASIPHLDESARRELLTLARRTLESYLETGTIPRHETATDSLLVPCGAFVSLHDAGRLRGCIGQIVSDQELYRTVQRCAVSAALEDYRFSPVTKEESGRLEIEISVLTPMQRIEETEQIEVGRHGLYIVRGAQRGLLLPQVAVQYGWDRGTFLNQACRKAGLKDDAWKQASTAIHVFEAQVFSE